MTLGRISPSCAARLARADCSWCDLFEVSSCTSGGASLVMRSTSLGSRLTGTRAWHTQVSEGLLSLRGVGNGPWLRKLARKRSGDLGLSSFTFFAIILPNDVNPSEGLLLSPWTPRTSCSAQPSGAFPEATSTNDAASCEENCKSAAGSYGSARKARWSRAKVFRSRLGGRHRLEMA